MPGRTEHLGVKPSYSTCCAHDIALRTAQINQQRPREKKRLLCMFMSVYTTTPYVIDVQRREKTIATERGGGMMNVTTVDRCLDRVRA